MPDRTPRRTAAVPCNAVTATAPAKVNLHLEVLRRRDDGYHEIETILQTVSLCDELHVELRERDADGPPRISLSVDPAGSVPASRLNLAWRAAELFCRTGGLGGELDLQLTKRIPVEAGLGGGSSDAAAVLAACNRLYGTGLSLESLEEMGAEIGSDVPFFIRGGTQVARGRGTDLQALPGIAKGKFLIVKPDIALRTSDVYAGLNMGLTLRSPKVNIRTVEALIARFPTGSWFGANRLEEVVLPTQPALQRLVQSLRESATVALMCGSGSAVFAVFGDERRRDEAWQEVVQPGWQAWAVDPWPGGVRVRDDADRA
jgi:4-diphosphocytidyl-2-C-methyl-D-erythritol kinase